MANNVHELSVLLVYSHFRSVNGYSCRTSGFCKTTCPLPSLIVCLFIYYLHYEAVQFSKGRKQVD